MATAIGQMMTRSEKRMIPTMVGVCVCGIVPQVPGCRLVVSRRMEEVLQGV